MGGPFSRQEKCADADEVAEQNKHEQLRLEGDSHRLGKETCHFSFCPESGMSRSRTDEAHVPTTAGEGRVEIGVLFNLLDGESLDR